MHQRRTRTVDLRGQPGDFGITTMDCAEVVTTEILHTKFGIIPGTRPAQEYWDAVEAKALEEGTYSGLETEFGQGGLSSLTFDSMVIRHGMTERAARLMTKLQYMFKGGVRW